MSALRQAQWAYDNLLPIEPDEDPAQDCLIAIQDEMRDLAAKHRDLASVTFLGNVTVDNAEQVEDQATRMLNVARDLVANLEELVSHAQRRLP
jgi:hypothetical protein